MRALALVALCLACGGGHRMSHMPVVDVDAPVVVAITPFTSLGRPVVTSRQWTTALVPRSGGGWDFVCQSYNNGVDVPTEWVIINLDTGAVAIDEGPNQVNANSNFQIASANTLVTTTNQLRASNGRVFFPLRYGEIGGNLDDQHYVNVSYFEPSTRSVEYLSSILDPGGIGGDRHAIVFSAIFDNAGTSLYFGTQAVVGDLPFVFKVDPSTLATTVIGAVGTAASANVKYAYYLAKDEGPGAQWLYVAVGQDPWELVKINVLTGAQTVLLTTTGPGLQTIEFEQRTEGWSVNTYSDGVQTRYWLADGAITAYPGGGAPPGGARTITPYSNALTSPPEIDWSRGIGEVLWRPNGSSSAFSSIPYDVNYTSAVTLESLARMTDGAILGNAEQYNGFFAKAAFSSALTWYGAWPLGLSQPVALALDTDEVYLTGYPNGALYLYDPTDTWDPGGAIPNPSSLGSWFASSGVKYSYFLELGGNGRLYSSGRRERDSSGSGIGYYTLVGKTFAGVNSAPLDNYIPRGMAVLDGISRVAFTGETLDASDAKMLVYSFDLALLQQYTIQAGLKNGGLLYETSDPAIVVGMVNDSPYQIYRFNVQTGTLLSITNLSAALGASTQKADGSIWAMVGNNLQRIDPETLAATTIADLTNYATVAFLLWSGDTLYMVGESNTLYYARVRNVQTGHLTP